MSKPYHFLLIYPRFEPSYWGMQYALPIIRRKSLMPPLGLITIAAMIPAAHEVRLVDLNTAEYVIPKLDESYARLGLSDEVGFRSVR